MKKYIFIVVALLAMGVCSCKKESKTDPEPTPQDPVVTSDSLNIKIRIYASVELMQYANYKAFVTPNGEAEKELPLTKTVELDSKLDDSAFDAITFMNYDKDSVLAYSFDMKVKKGTLSLRFEGTAKDTVMPETIGIFNGYSYAIQNDSLNWDKQLGDASVHRDVYSNTLGAFLSLKSIAGPFTFNIK